MKHLSFILFFLISSSGWAEAPMCELNPFPNLMENIQSLQEVIQYPKMNMSYTLNKDCSYRVATDVVILDSTDSVKDFLYTKIIDARTNLESSDRKMVLDYKVEQSGGSYTQSVRVKKVLEKVVKSNCSVMKATSEEALTKCVVDPSSGLFEKNETTISCKKGVGGLKLCSFLTEGKAERVLTRGPCSLAAPGAAETFQGIYRLAHYISNGNVNNIKRGSTAVTKIYEAAKKSGSKPVTLTGSVP